MKLSVLLTTSFALMSCVQAFDRVQDKKNRVLFERLDETDGQNDGNTAANNNGGTVSAMGVDNTGGNDNGVSGSDNGNTGGGVSSLRNGIRKFRGLKGSKSHHSSKSSHSSSKSFHEPVSISSKSHHSSSKSFHEPVSISSKSHHSSSKVTSSKSHHSSKTSSSKSEHYVPPGKGKGYVPPGKGKGYVPPGKGKGYVPPSSSKGYVPPGKGKGYVPPGKGKGYVPPGKGKGYVPPGKGGSGPIPVPMCQYLELTFYKDDLKAGYKNNSVGTYFDNVPFYNSSNGELLGYYSDAATSLSSGECVGTGSWNFGSARQFTTQINFQFTCWGEYNSITGGNGEYGCANGFERKTNEDDVVLQSEITLCGPLCPVALPPMV